MTVNKINRRKFLKSLLALPLLAVVGKAIVEDRPEPIENYTVDWRESLSNEKTLQICKLWRLTPSELSEFSADDLEQLSYWSDIIERLNNESKSNPECEYVGLDLSNYITTGKRLS